MDVEESESKKSKVSEASRKRQSETDIRDLDVERSQRDEEAQASGSGQKRPAEDPPDDSERGERLGVLEEAGTRVPAESGTRSGSEERTVAASRHSGAGSVSPKSEKIVCIMDSDTEIEEYNVDDYSEDEYVGKWKKVGKKGKKIDVADDDVIIPQTRQSCQCRVPSWP